MASFITYSNCLRDSFLSAIPKEVLALSNQGFHKITGKEIFPHLPSCDLSDFLYEKTTEVAIICAVFSLASHNFLMLTGSLGTLWISRSGAEQRKTIRDLTSLKNDLEKANIDLKEGNKNLANTNQSFKKELTSLKKLLKNVKNSELKLRNTQRLIAQAEKKLSETDQQLGKKITLLEQVSQHITEECCKLSQNRTELDESLSLRIKELKEVILQLKQKI